MSNTDSPLHIAVKNGNIDLVRILLENQGDVNATDADGLTPLQLATQIGNMEMVTLIAQHGAKQTSQTTPSASMSGPVPLSGIFKSLTDVDKIKTFGANAVSTIKTLSSDTVKLLHTLFKAFWICTAGGLLSVFIGTAIGSDIGGAEGFAIFLILLGALGVLVGLILGCVLFYRLWTLISIRIAKPTNPPTQIHLIMRRIPFGIGLLYSLLVEAWKLPRNLNKILQQRGVPLQVNEWLALGFFIALVVMVVTWSHIPLPTFWSFSFMAVCCVGIFHLKALTDGTVALLKQEEQNESGQNPASVDPKQVGEKFRIFRAGKLLGMITASEIGEKHTAKVLNDADFVLLPLETFLAEIETPDRPFQLFRDGKRIDQYTLQQIRELHESGQTQPIDHVLVPMPVFLGRKQVKE